MYTFMVIIHKCRAAKNLAVLLFDFRTDTRTHAGNNVPFFGYTLFESANKYM